MKALIDGIKACDAWVEFNYKLIFYSTVYDKITEDPNNRPRYMNQNGVHPELLVRNIGKVDNVLLNKFIQGLLRSRSSYALYNARWHGSGMRQ